MAHDAVADQTALAEVRMFLSDDGSRSYDAGAARVEVGGVRFRGWQIHRLPPTDQECHLVRTDYDLAVVPYAPEPVAVDVGFRFLTADVAVLDAIPRGMVTAEGPTTYTLTSHFNFVRDHGGRTSLWSDGSPRPEIPLPAVSASTDVLGIGGPDLCWRHTATAASGVRQGSHTGWFVLVTPCQVHDLRVEAYARFHAAPEDEVGLALSSSPDEFSVRLPLDRDDRRALSYVEASLATRDRPITAIRLGFCFDVVGYSERGVDEQREAQHRLATLTQHVVRDLGVDIAAADSQTAGDSVTIFLP